MSRDGVTKVMFLKSLKGSTMGMADVIAAQVGGQEWLLMETPLGRENWDNVALHELSHHGDIENWEVSTDMPWSGWANEGWFKSWALQVPLMTSHYLNLGERDKVLSPESTNQFKRVHLRAKVVTDPEVLTTNSAYNEIVKNFRAKDGAALFSTYAAVDIREMAAVLGQAVATGGKDVIEATFGSGIRDQTDLLIDWMSGPEGKSYTESFIGDESKVDEFDPVVAKIQSLLGEGKQKEEVIREINDWCVDLICQIVSVEVWRMDREQLEAAQQRGYAFMGDFKVSEYVVVDEESGERISGRRLVECAEEVIETWVGQIEGEVGEE